MNKPSIYYTISYRKKVAGEFVCLTQCSLYMYQNLQVGEIRAQGLRCRGERHDQVIARQREALADLRDRTKALEQLKPPRK